MKKIFKLTVFLAILLMFMGGGSCSDDIDPQKAILGKWRLVKVTAPFTPTGPISYNYSKYNIIYEFKADGTLTVSGNIEQIDWYGGHEIGEHTYSIVGNENGYSLIIGYGMYGCNISFKTLVMDERPVDGYLYNLDRI